MLRSVNFLSPVYTTTTVTTDDNLDITGLMSPQSFGTAMEASAPQAIVSVHQKQLVVQEQVTVQEISRYVAPAPVIQNFAPTFASTSDSHSQQLPPVYTTTTVTTDDNLDMTDLVNPQFFQHCSGTFSASCRWSSSSLGRVY